MEFQVSKREFVKGLARVQNVADKKSAMPILSNVLVTAEGSSHLRLSATDLLLSVVSTIPADIRKGGSVALQARAIFDMAKALPDGEITVTVSPNYSARVTSGKRRFDLSGMPGDDFPSLPSVGKAELRELPIDVLGELISLTSFSMSTDDTRPHLAGALLEADGNILRMVTTDGHRLSKAEKRIGGNWAGKNQLSLLIPAKGIHELKRLLDEAKAEKVKAPAQKTEGSAPSEEVPSVISIGQAGSNVFLRRDGTTMAVKLVDAAFPAYQQVIPQSNDRIARIHRLSFLDALRAVSLVATDRTSGVKLQFDGTRLIISSENPDIGAVTDEIEAELRGSKLTVGFNAKYLIDVLSALSCEEVSLELSGELDPGVVRPVGGQDFVGVVMPMRI